MCCLKYFCICNLFTINFVCFLFKIEKYDYVGRLLKPGESHSYYTDEEETPTNKLHLENPKQCESEKPKTETADQPLDNSNEKQDETKSSNGLVKQDDNQTLQK
jgi:hypothetical protein